MKTGVRWTLSPAMLAKQSSDIYKSRCCHGKSKRRVKVGAIGWPNQSFTSLPSSPTKAHNMRRPPVTRVRLAQTISPKSELQFEFGFPHPSKYQNANKSARPWVRQAQTISPKSELQFGFGFPHPTGGQKRQSGIRTEANNSGVAGKTAGNNESARIGGHFHLPML